MLRTLSLLICLSLLWSDGSAQQPDRPADHVILISIDGFRPDFYQQERWPAPMLQQMAGEGVQSDGVRGIFPSVTFASHTTLVTGVLPDRHGIYYNAPFEPEGQTGRWYWYYDALKAETIWEVARDEGLVTASINWPVTVDAPIDYNIPDVWDLDGDVIAAMRRYAHPAGFMEELEERATGRMYGDMLNSRYRMSEDRRGAMVSYLIKEYQPNLITVHLVATDSYQHRFGREHPEVDRAVAAVDRAISRMVEAADQAGILDRLAFVISGDHGFTNVSVALAPNVWLVEAGLLEDRPDRGEWRAAFHGGFLHLRDPSDGEAVRQVRRILESQPASVRKLFRIVDRDELDSLGADPNVALALAADPIVTMNNATSGPAVRPASGGTHGHLSDITNMHTGFVAWGAGVRSEVRAPVIDMVDVAPFAAALLGLELEEAAGLVIPGFLAP